MSATNAGESFWRQSIARTTSLRTSGSALHTDGHRAEPGRWSPRRRRSLVLWLVAMIPARGEQRRMGTFVARSHAKRSDITTVVATTLSRERGTRCWRHRCSSR